MRQLNIANADVASPVLTLPEGIYKHLYLVIEGTNSATAVTLGDLGRVTITKNGRPLVASVETVSLMHIANLFGGKVGFSSTASSSLFAMVPIFCYDPDNPGNVLVVTDKDRVSVTITWGGNFTTRLASGDVKLCGDFAEGIQQYHLVYTQYDFSLAAAGTIKQTLPGENFFRLFCYDMSDTDIQRIQVEVDGKIIHDASRIETLYSSNFLSRIEDAGSTQQLGTGYVTADVMAHIPIVSNQQISELLSDNINITVIAGGALAAFNVVTLTADFTPAEQALSQSIVNQNLQMKLSRKHNLGKGRAISVYNQAQIDAAKRFEVEK